MRLLKGFHHWKILKLILVLAFSITQSACMNAPPPAKNSRVISQSSSSGNGAPALPNYSLSSVNVIQSSSSGTTPPTLRLYVDLNTSSTKSAQDACDVGSKPCSCLLEWTEVNETSGSSVSVTRKAQGVVTQVQPGNVECRAPEAFLNEIDERAEIRIQVVGTGTNASKFTTSILGFSRAGSDLSGQFQDANGNSFSNISRYVCIEKFQRGTRIYNRKLVADNQTDPALVFGSQFCFWKINETGQLFNFCNGSMSGQSGNGKGNDLLSDPRKSSQLYPYHFYIQATEQADAFSQNSAFFCPKVTEPDSASLGPQLTPYDSTFSLALSPSANFSVGVEAPRSKLADPNNPVQGSSCFSQATPNSSDPTQAAGSAFVKSCLGFAAKPLSGPGTLAGSCPVLKKLDGSALPTYRLRRYFLTHPTQFNTDGRMVPRRQTSLDMIYVLDRPVDVNSRNFDYTVAGPKPCPQSFYDAEAGLYRASNDPAWRGRSLDGLELPKVDSRGNDVNTMSCSSSLLVLSHHALNDPALSWSLATVNARNPSTKLQSVPIRPFDPWTPRWEEDTTFLACAPESQSIGGVEPRKAPLIAVGSDGTPGTEGKGAWCEKTLPTLNPKPLSDAAVEGAKSTLEKAQRDAGARERTIDPESIPDLERAPLAAPQSDVVRALLNEPSYRCTYTWDEFRGRARAGLTPARGCCNDLPIPPEGMHVEIQSTRCNRRSDAY